MRHCISLAIAILLLFICTCSAVAADVLTPEPMSPISISGEHIIWASAPEQDWDIYYYNTKTKETKNLSQNPYDQIRPSLWGDLVVWEDHRNHPDSDWASDIYLYDLSTGELKKLNRHDGSHKSPLISNGKVVWIDEQSGTDIYLYDLSTGNQTLIHRGLRAYGLSFDGRIIAWTDFRDGDGDIYAYDLVSEEEIQITGTDRNEIGPLVAGGVVLWGQPENNDSHLYTYDFRDQVTRRISAGRGQHRPIAFDGNNLILEKDGQLYLNQNPSVTVQTEITLPVFNPDQILLQGSDIIYLQGGYLYQTSIAEAVKEPSEAQPPDRSEDNRSRHRSDSTGKEDKELLDYTKEHRIQSPDGLLTLIIHPYTFLRNFSVVIEEQEFTPDAGFRKLTPMYVFVTEQRPSRAIDVVVKLPQENYASVDDRTVSLYQQPEDNWVYLPGTQELGVNQTEKQIRTELTNLFPVALMSFSARFHDIQNHWGQDAIQVVAAHHILHGYPDGSFKPDAAVTRAEFIKLLVTLSGETLRKPASPSFADTSQNHWAYAYIETAYVNGWVQGYQGKFNPDTPITREEMVTMFMRVFGGKLSVEQQTISFNDFGDVHTISPWAEEYLKQAIAVGLIQGANGQLEPKGHTTRAASATVIYRYLVQTGRF